MNPRRVTTIEPGYGIQLPSEWVDALGIKGHVVLSNTPDGILIQPVTRPTWDDVFATKLSVHPAVPSDDSEITDITGDDLVY